jgi:hypothetical protein
MLVTDISTNVRKKDPSCDVFVTLSIYGVLLRVYSNAGGSHGAAALRLQMAYELRYRRVSGLP